MHSSDGCTRYMTDCCVVASPKETQLFESRFAACNLHALDGHRRCRADELCTHITKITGVRANTLDCQWTLIAYVRRQGLALLMSLCIYATMLYLTGALICSGNCFTVLTRTTRQSPVTSAARTLHRLPQHTAPDAEVHESNKPAVVPVNNDMLLSCMLT